jgi:hypothetical protein
MKRKYFFIIFLGICQRNLCAQNVGFGITTPKARLHIADSNVVFTGPATLPATTNFNPPLQGAGTRMMWYPQKAAFRVGIVEGGHWDKDNIGRYSLAAGYNTKAIGEGSIAAGSSSTALGSFSTAMGSNTFAQGDNSTTMGFYTIASGTYSTALGYGSHASGISSASIGYTTVASGSYSTALGLSAIAAGNNSTAMGGFTNAAGNSSTAMGAYTIAAGDRSTAMGYYTNASGFASIATGNSTKAKSSYSLVVGSFNDTIANNSLFEIGNGNSDDTRKNAMTVLNDGSVGIGITNPRTRLDVFLSGSGSSYHPQTSVGIEHSGSHYIDLLTSNTGETGILFGNASYAGADGGITYRATNVTDPRSLYFRVTSTTRMMIYGTGSAWLQGSLTQASDVRLKKNIVPLSNPLVSIQQLNGYTYNWKDEGRDKEQQIGVIAQELQKVYPQLVKENSNGELSVNYIGLIPVLLEGMKEQQKQIEELKQVVNKLLNK